MEKLIYGSLPEWVFSGYGYSDGDGYSNGDGSGSGYGSGYGYGYGDGYGDGYGNGSGSGNRDGYGDGSGYGSGYGYGDGSGSGYGNGDGSGSGYGYGDGYGDGYGWISLFNSTVHKWSGEQKSRLDHAMVEATAIAFWKSSHNGLSCNGGNIKQPVSVGTIHETTGPLVLCQKGVLHATMQPEQWRGERLWIVALYGEVKCEYSKFGALKREILGEIK